MVKDYTIWVVLVLAMMYEWKLRQVDVNNAFLKGFFKEVYTRQPLGFEVFSSHEPLVCRLQKVLYRLKQDPRAWFEG